MLNKVLLIGRLTSQPELRYTGSNIPYSRFNIAVNRYNEGTDFINVVVWRKQAENVCNFLDKGSLVAVEGSISVSRYDDNEGNKRTVTEVTAQNVQFLDKKASSESTESTNDYGDNDFEEIDDEVSIDDNFLE